MTTSGLYPRISRVTVLFVDDDEDTRFAYQTVAAAEGLGVQIAADGHEAIAVAGALVPDVIVLDVHLPDLDGVEVVRRLRASPRTCAIPIIIVSGDDTEEGDAAIRASGCEAHLVKPCSADDLLRLVGVLAMRRREDLGAIGVAAGSGR